MKRHSRPSVRTRGGPERRPGGGLACGLAVLALVLFPGLGRGQVQARPQARDPDPYFASRFQRTEFPTYGFTLDFETGDLRGWRPSGDAFNCQPTRGEHPAVLERGQPSGHQGQFWVTSYGCSGSDRATGTLVSSPFEIPAGTLSFLVGGGSDFRTRVELRWLDPIEGSIRLEHASGGNSESLHRVTWELTRHAGRRGEIVIVDQSSEPWGHVDVDDFRFSAAPGEGQPDPQRPEVPPPLPPPSQERRVSVPALFGHHVGAAREVLQRVGLRLGEITYEPIPGSAPDSVVGQRPEPGAQVPPGAAVSVTVSQGVRVPDVRRGGVEAARERLARVGLAGGEIRGEPSSAPVGSIVDQSPPPGATVPLRTPVRLVVAQGVPVPKLIDRARDVVPELLRRAGLRPGPVTEKLSERPVGTVLSQDPGPGTTVPLGTAVTFVVAQGVPVPDLTRQDSREAARTLEDARLRLGAVSEQLSDRPVGTVIRQSPAPRAIVPAGATVDVVVAQGVQVPYLIEFPSVEVAGRLQARRLRAGREEEELSDRPVFTVLRQEPAPGVTVSLATPVHVVIARGVEVPPLLELDRERVPGLLERLGLRLGEVAEELSERDVGTVLEQDPAAGVEVPLATPVGLVVAQGVEVPELVGQHRSEVAGVLTGLDLELGAVEEELSDRPLETVLRQDPAPRARVPLRSSIRVVVAQGVSVPDLLGLAQRELGPHLEAPGLTAGAVTVRPSSSPPGTILEQDPDPGTVVPLATPIVLAVAEGVGVPDLLTRTSRAARALLDEGDLVLGEIERRPAYRWPGTVLEQRPESGIQVALGSEVEVVVASVPSSAAVAAAGGFLALLGGGVYAGRRRLGRRARRGVPRSVQPDAKIGLSPHRDLGSQRLEAPGPGVLGPEIHIRAVRGAGRQTLEAEGPVAG